MAWQVTRSEVLAWLETGPSQREVDAVFEALQVIVADPHGAGTICADKGLVFHYLVPDTDLVVVFLVAQQFHTIKVIEITDTH